MRHARPSRLLLLALGATLLLPATANAEVPAIEYDGDVISVARAAELSCNALDPANVQCFATTSEMEASVAAFFARDDALTAAVLTTGYVVVYEDDGYNGASRTLSADVYDLGSIGWNDRISSFKSFGATGNFRENSPPSGFTYNYGTSTAVTSVGSTYNDKFSYFNIN